MQIQEYLKNFNKGDKKLKLDTMEYFMNFLGNPEKNLKIIHVAGTNGKGSVCEMLSNVLVSSGYKTGKFIGPHLIKYNERISINNKNISDNELEELINYLEPEIAKYNGNNTEKVSYFELVTIIAFSYFNNNKCDFVILETGLGGIYDATNICEPLISVITSIGYDHMELLGSTLGEIARNKAGIIKNNSKTVFFSQSEAVDNVIKSTCKEKQNKLYLLDKKDIINYTYDSSFQKFDYKNYKEILINLNGRKQCLNACMCLECMDILKAENYNISETSIRTGLKTVIHKARFETINEDPEIIFDGAHNITAIENFKDSVDMYYKNVKKVFIISILKSKDYDTIIKSLLKDSNATFIFTSGNDSMRYVEGKTLYEIALKYSKNANICVEELENVFQKVYNEYRDNVIFVVGSFYIYGSVVEILKKYRK